jgi:hypothetical protein
MRIHFNHLTFSFFYFATAAHVFILFIKRSFSFFELNFIFQICWEYEIFCYWNNQADLMF